ncbi:hypothetical protein IV203_031634 [Nitzschia inconspicua]|uniref:Uncharacterized protein n=1 Tax=Nitzschia inconspicua TaxID=303405 RepID=A0A9K3Q2T7_9STRA|nr:hypothetical protein IV203_031634 [Nitzschia inconspicua]
MIEQEIVCADAPFVSGVFHHGPVIGAQSELRVSPSSTPTVNSSKKRKTSPSRRVSFGPTDTMACIERSSDLTEEDKECRWFQAHELEEIKSTARNLCVQESKGIHIAAKESTRGMDVYFPSRQRHNRKFINHVLQACHYRCVGDSEQVRLLVERWSAKSRQRAMDRAHQDFQEAYSS